ncbi:MAG: hypothetical protein QM627_05215 [Luteolibacter sp.]
MLGDDEDLYRLTFRQLDPVFGDEPVYQEQCLLVGFPVLFSDISPVAVVVPEKVFFRFQHLLYDQACHSGRCNCPPEREQGSL